MYSLRWINCGSLKKENREETEVANEKKEIENSKGMGWAKTAILLLCTLSVSRLASSLVTSTRSDATFPGVDSYRKDLLMMCPSLIDSQPSTFRP
ncbi:hypothetical protein EVAR_73902_1 [Eumeta japonica]|uniref:Uncharacterized protein n=1 Tax=Eumeta variegata TaxID=151549 RepID=A0A4C1S9F3_EUMVA|nr:hypothetical protein EVAR_73902_1 [Eumeta japonica]